MSSIIEDVVNSLVDFESVLEMAKAGASEAKKKMLKDADDWAESAKAAAISKAQQIASERIAKAREEAESEAVSIKKRGETSLRTFEGSISKRKGDAMALVASALLGERG